MGIARTAQAHKEIHATQERDPVAANHHFAHHGFRGASLRDIARDAQVSLTLLNHHFGSKFQLLSAVIDTHRAMLDERASALLQLMTAGPASSPCRTWCRSGSASASRPRPRRTARISCG
jgi:AcrR family transcriptional regulator